METLGLPSEMVAESVVNNIQTGGGRDNSGGDERLLLQLVIALSVGENKRIFFFIKLANTFLICDQAAPWSC